MTVTSVYQLEYLGSEWPKIANFDAESDDFALQKAQALYRARRHQEGFKLWRGSDLVYSEPAATDP